MVTDCSAAQGQDSGLSEPAQTSNPLMSAGAHPHDRLASAVGAGPLDARSQVAPGEAPDARPGSENPSAALVCPRHGEIRPPMPMPELRHDLWRCPCGRTMVLPSVVEVNRRLQGAYLRATVHPA